MADDTWVCCDSCSKWRRVPQSVADGLDENTQWYCKDNSDPVYNSCDVPQELTDTEIDERTAMPVQEAAQPEELAVKSSKLRKRPPVWQIITKNMYMHRERKRQDEDEIMVCQCKPIWATDMSTIGCGDHCLNRMLNIECVPKFCPCGERCTNQSFSKRQYAKLEIHRAGAKGYGLFTAEDLTPGQFIIEYVGEVLEEDEYARRKEFYTTTGQRHYYFMNVGNGEVIDATRRGGLGRFINHSCKPNCETQKWVVRGELAIGLFAMQDIPAGTELTFDYNFERYGDKPMKCLCGSSACRGMIGGSQETVLRLAQAVVVPEEEENELEPIMVTEKEADPALTAILDRAVGLGWENGWDSKLQRRLEHLAGQKGVSLEDAATAREIYDASDVSDGDDDIAAAAAAAVATVARRRPKSTARKGRVAKPRVRQVDPDWDGDGEDNVEQTNNRTPAAAARASLMPKRTPSLSATPSQSALLSSSLSEVSRRLKGLTLDKSGRLREVNDSTVLQVLRLFNLCDIGYTVSKGAASDGKDIAIVDSAQASPRRRVIPEGGSYNTPRPQTHTTYKQSPVGAGVGGQGRELTNRQKARVGDALQLLDVIEKTNDLTAGRAFVRCGVLRQLLSCVGHNLSTHYKVIHLKMLRAVDNLPLTTDDVVHTRTAHGSFADLIKELTRQPHRDVTDKAWAFLRKIGIVAVNPEGGLSRPLPHRPPLGGRGAMPMTGDRYQQQQQQQTRPPMSRFGGGPGGGGLLQHSSGGRGGGPWSPRPSVYAESPHTNDTPRSEFNGRASQPGSRKRSRWDDEGVPESARSGYYLETGSGYGQSPGLPPQQQQQQQQQVRYHQEPQHAFQGRQSMRPESAGGSHNSSESGQIRDNRPWESAEANGRNTERAPPLVPPPPLSETIPPPPPPHPRLPPALSPMTDDDDDEDLEEGEQRENGTENNFVAAPAPTDTGVVGYDGEYDLANEGSFECGDGFWEKPDRLFEGWVDDVIRHRLGKYEQPDHPARLSRDEASALFKQIRREVLAKEQDAYADRQRTGVNKPIEGKKLEPRIKDFVRDRVRRWHDKRGVIAGH